MEQFKIPNMDENFLNLTKEGEHFYLRTANEEYAFTKEQMLFFIGVTIYLFNEE